MKTVSTVELKSPALRPPPSTTLNKGSKQKIEKNKWKRKKKHRTGV